MVPPQGASCPSRTRIGQNRSDAQTPVDSMDCISTMTILLIGCLREDTRSVDGTDRTRGIAKRPLQLYRRTL